MVGTFACEGDVARALLGIFDHVGEPSMQEASRVRGEGGVHGGGEERVRERNPQAVHMEQVVTSSGAAAAVRGKTATPERRSDCRVRATAGSARAVFARDPRSAGEC